MYILHKILRNHPKMSKMSINCIFLSDLISEYTSKLKECTGYGITLVEEMEKGMIDMNLFPNCVKLATMLSCLNIPFLK